MVKRTAPSTCDPPIPKGAVAELERRLPQVNFVGWDKCPPQFVSPSPGEGVPGAWFDPDAVVRVVRALGGLKHTKGKWARRPLVPDGWQLVWFIAPVFGWRYSLDDPDDDLAGSRIVRTAFVEVPRKNGKSTISSGLAIVLLVADGELGGEVYAAASTRDQARIVFDEAKKMAMAAPALRGKIQPLAAVIRVPKTGSIFRVLSKIAEAAHGLNVSGAVIDELHVHKRRDLVDAIETGTGARRQPLIVIITTADEGGVGTIYEEKHERARKCARRIIRDPTFYGVIWAADETDDPFAEATWMRCNPGLGRTVSLAYLRKEAERAKTEPSYFPTFCRLHLNRRMRATSRFLVIHEWDASAGLVVPEQLTGRECYGGLDLSATTDLTALSLVFPVDEALANLSWYWLPEHGLSDRIKRDQVPYDEWARAGFLTLTEGNVVDYDRVIDVLDEVRRTYDLRSVSHDRWQAGAVVNHLSRLGIAANPVPQTYQGMSAATKELERHVKRGAFHHGGNPVHRWCADCVEVIRDPNDNIRPVKPDRQKSIHRVDGITADVMAIDGWMRRPEQVGAASAPAPTSEDRSIYSRSRLKL